MTSKERMLSAVQGILADRVPIAPIYLDLFLAEDVRKKAFEGYHRFMGDRNNVVLDPDIEINIQASSIIDAWKTLQPYPDWVFWMPLMPTRDWLSQCELRREGDRLWRIHEPSGEREELSRFVKTGNALQDSWEKPIPGSREEIDNLVPIRSPEEIIDNGTLSVIRKIIETLGSETFICGGLGTPFWDCYFKIGFQGLMEMPLKNPELFDYLLERQHLALTNLCHAYVQVGIDGIFIEECMTSADLISPRYYDRFVFDSSKKFFKEIQSINVVDILYYCGEVIPRLQRLLEISPSVLAVEESKKGFSINLHEIAETVGKNITLFGNIDSTKISLWNDEEMEAELQAQYLAASASRGFIFSMGSPFPIDTPRNKVNAFLRKAQELSVINPGMI